MAKKLDKIVVVDIEATCWEGRVPDGMIHDIIEVGVCLLDVNTEEIINYFTNSELLIPNIEI